MMLHARTQSRLVDGVELVLFPDADEVRYYGVTDPDDFAWMVARLTPHPWKCFEQPLRLTNEAAVDAIPHSHIVCTATLATRDPQLMADARAAGRFSEIDTGHDLMIIEPAAVAEALLQVAAHPR
jgi:hypothetical protein